MTQICDESHGFAIPVGSRDFMHDSGKHVKPLWVTSDASLPQVTHLSTRIGEASSHACHKSVTHATDLRRKARVYETHGTSRFHARLWKACDASVGYI